MKRKFKRLDPCGDVLYAIDEAGDAWRLTDEHDAWEPMLELPEAEAKTTPFYDSNAIIAGTINRINANVLEPNDVLTDEDKAEAIEMFQNIFEDARSHSAAYSVAVFFLVICALWGAYDVIHAVVAAVVRFWAI